MPTYAYVAQDGLPKGGGQNPDSVPDGAVVLTGGWLLSDLPRLMLVDGAWTTRPTLPGPAVDGGDLWFDGLPDGASVTITNAITGAAVPTPSTWVGGVAMTLPKGSYLVQITAPNPWLDFESLIEVDGGDPQRELDALDNALRERREAMKCSRLQGRLVLGPAVCAQIDAIAADPETPWAMRETIQYAIEWSRLSETMDTLGWIMGFSAEQMDALFEAAMQVNV